jgi:uncharacterized protein
MTPVGPVMMTYSGRRFWPAFPRPEDVALEDIAHALSRLCRFGGHIGPHYSVAEHSVRVAQAILRETGDTDLACEGLFHDAAEAYGGDVIWPVKVLLGEAYAERVERPIDRAVRLRFGLAASEPRIVKKYDLILLATEKRDLSNPMFADVRPTDEWLVGHGYATLDDYQATRADVLSIVNESVRAQERWGADLGPIGRLAERIVPWSAEEAEDRFTVLAERLLSHRTAGRASRQAREPDVPVVLCSVCGQRLEPLRSVADGQPTLRGHHPCPHHPEAR